jgi:hypothetical protein
MLWTLTFQFLNNHEILLGVHFAHQKDPVYNIPVYTLTLGLLFMNISLSVGKKKREF